MHKVLLMMLLDGAGLGVCMYAGESKCKVYV